MAVGSAAAGRSDGRWWRGLAARATLLVGAMLALLAALLIGAMSLEVRSDATRDLERRTAERIERLATSLSGSDARGLDEPLRTEGLAYAVLLSSSGAVIAGVAPAAVAPTLSEDALAATDRPGMAVVATGEDATHASKVLTLADGRRATLRIGAPLDAVDAMVETVMTRGLLATIAFLLFALPAMAVFADRAASPLRTLTRAVARPGSVVEEMREAGARLDEVGALARAHLSIARDLADNADALHRLTFDDPVTQLPNRASLTSRLAFALQLNRPVTLIKVDLDGLGRVAAGLGQQHGDEAIRAAARRLRDVSEAFRRGAAASGAETFLLARAADSGFALLIDGADAALATQLAEEIVQAFDEPLHTGETHVATNLSIGAALAPQDGDETGALMRSAAAAVGAARAAGPNEIRFAGAELTRRAYGRLKLEQDLRRALRQGDLELHFQPQIALKSGAASGAEALLRWSHPIRGPISPAEFVPVAEECGLMDQLGRFVLAEASRVAAMWSARGMPLRIAVNASPVQFRRARFGASMLEIIEAAGADPAWIELEITEGAAMSDPEHAARELAPLKEAGVRIAVDDFGTGYSNLAALTRLPFDVLKIDRGFVRDATTEAGARVVVGTVIGMAETLGFETVAEGVETAGQLAFVASHGCTYGQGYLFGRPMPVAAFETWRAERQVAGLRSLSVRATRSAPSQPAAPVVAR